MTQTSGFSRMARLSTALLAACLWAASLAGCGGAQPVAIPPPRQVGPSGLVVSPSDISMSPSQTASIVASEKGYKGTFGESDDCSGIVTVESTGGASFTVTAVADGLCTITISDASGGSHDVGVSIQSVVIGGQ